MILDKLREDDLDIQGCRAQTYDNAYVMAGREKSVQLKIKEVNQKARFVQCSNHSLNLAGNHAASETTSSVTFFGVVVNLFKFSANSTHRWDVLTSRTWTMKRLSDTRWSATADAIKAIKTQYLDVILILEELTDENGTPETRFDAAVLLNGMQSFSFPSYASFWFAILTEIDDAQKYLQQKGINVDLCAWKIKSLKETLTSKRDEWISKSIAYSNRLCEELGIVPSRPFRVGKPRNADGVPQSQPLSLEERLGGDMNCNMDRIVREIESRFKQLQTVAQENKYLLPKDLLDPACEIEINELHTDFDHNDFIQESTRLQAFASAANRTQELQEGDALQLLQFIQKYSLDISVPNIVIALRVSLTIGVSVAFCERSFSKLALNQELFIVNCYGRREIE